MEAKSHPKTVVITMTISGHSNLEIVSRHLVWTLYLKCQSLIIAHYFLIKLRTLRLGSSSANYV